MKLTAILLVTACLQVSANTYSQVITLNLQNASLDKVVHEIERQTKVNFFYEEGLFQNAKPVTIAVNKVSLEETLDLSFKNQPFDYKIVGKTVFVRKKTIQLKDQVNKEPLIDIRGRVVNENGEPVQASITIKGTTKGTTSNKNGEFQLHYVEEEATLIVSGVGIENKEVFIKGLSQLTIIVKIAVRSLDEVQMIAYGSTTKRFNTGNVSAVKSEEIEKQPVNNPLLTLQGRVPGVFITQNSGVPGGGISIRIRGQNSIQNGNEPLYIIDGVPYTSTLLPNLGSDVLGLSSGSAGSNPLSFVNPSDIESISVLKDADATAIYGSRGANGVVLITTKKGGAGKTTVRFNLSSGIEQVARKLNLMDTQQYLEMRREAFKNDGESPDQYNAPDLLYWDTTRYTDWQKKLIGGTAHYTKAQASISGGNVYTQYVISGNYIKETTVFPGDFSDQKGAVHVNINNSSANQKFKSSLSMNYMADHNQLPNLDLASNIILPPNSPEPFNSDGSLNWANSTWASGNPLAFIKMKYNSLTNNLVSNLNMSYQLSKIFTLKSSFGYTNMQVDETSTIPIASQDPAYLSTGSASFASNSIRSWIVEPQFVYQQQINNSKIEVLIGTTFQQNKSKGQTVQGTGYTSDLILESMQAAPQLRISSITNVLYKYNAAFARLNYNLKNKYIVNLTGRRDGSSRFGDNNKFHTFGSGGVAWIFSSENFIQQLLPFLSYGKFRGSYGTTGSDQIGDYKFYDLYNTNNFQPYQGMVGLSPSSLYNPNLQWEKTKKLEGAVDLGLFKDKILLNASYYHNRSSNQLLSYIISGVSGFTSYPTNFPAIVENKGWEFSLNTTNIKSRNFVWESSLNLTIPRNELVEFPNLDKSSYYNRLVKREPVTISKVYHLLGVNDSTGIYQFTDSKGNPTYSPASGTDRTVLVNTAPKCYGGFSNSISYKNIQLNFIFQFTKQIGLNYIFQPFQSPGGFGTNRTVDVMNRWRNPGDMTPTQMFTQSFSSNAATAYRTYASQSDGAYIDASFIRLKNIEISYKLASNFLKKAHFQNCRVYAQGQNLWAITKYKGLDPEYSVNVVTPPLRVITMGVDVSF